MAKTVKSTLLKHIRYVALIVIILTVGVFFAGANPNFAMTANFMNIIRQTCVLAIVAIGMTGVILTGGIDLSVGTSVALCGVAAAKTVDATQSVAAGIIAALMTGILVGVINGVLTGCMNMPPFIATLAMQSVAGGATMMISNASAIKIEVPAIKMLSQGELLGVPILFWLVVAMYLIGWWALNHTTFGQYLYAIGGNERAAKAMGINVKMNLLGIYAFTGVCVGIGSLITMGRLGSAQPYAGKNLEFDVITAVVLGGTSLVGGIGSLCGTALGVVLVGVITNGLSLMSVSTFTDYLVKGALILIAVGVDVIFVIMKEKRLTPEVKSEGTEEKEENNITEYCKNEKVLTLKMDGISKAFPGMIALDHVSLSVSKGEVLALMGENGAGKSTLMKILAGEYKKDSGRITVNDKVINIDSAQKAQDAGIALIHQEFSLVPELSVYQNIFLGKELKSKIPGIVDAKGMQEKAKEALESIGIVEIDVRKTVKDLTVSEQQMVEIAKVISTDAWLIVMDEPTSSLTENEKERLFQIIRQLKEKGTAIIYISHKMQEIFEITDQITVLRDGQYVGSRATKEVTENTIIQMMVGRELNNIFDRERNPLGKTIMKVENLTCPGKFQDISFEVREGEVLGFSGLMGAGRTEVMKCIFGLDRAVCGQIYMDGRKLNIRNPKDAIDASIAYVPEDRKAEGFVPFMSIRKNMACPSYRRISRFGVYNRKDEKKISDTYVKKLNVKTVSDEKNVLELSGGNQQKVILGKWMAMHPKVLILDEPTRGIDVGAKAEIHQLIGEIARQGLAVILISSELPELLGCADNIVVLRDGMETGYFNAADVTQDIIMEKSILTVN